MAPRRPTASCARDRRSPSAARRDRDESSSLIVALRGCDCEIEVGRPLPHGDNVVVAILDHGREESFVVHTHDGADPPARVTRPVYAVTNFPERRCAPITSSASVVAGWTWLSLSWRRGRSATVLDSSSRLAV